MTYTPGKIRVVEVATGRVFYAWPVDAREMLTTSPGEYATPDWDNHTAPAFPLDGAARATRQKVTAKAAPVEVAPVEVEPVAETTTAETATVRETGPAPATHTGPMPSKRGRKPKAEPKAEPK